MFAHWPMYLTGMLILSYWNAYSALNSIFPKALYFCLVLQKHIK